MGFDPSQSRRRADDESFLAAIRRLSLWGGALRTLRGALDDLQLSLHELPENYGERLCRLRDHSRSGVQIHQGRPKKVEWTSDSGNRRFGYFCGDCGSRIAHGQTPSIGFLSLRAGTFDDTSWVEPVGDIWTRSAQKWVKFLPLTDKGQPRDYTPFVEAFRAQERF